MSNGAWNGAVKAGTLITPIWPVTSRIMSWYLEGMLTVGYSLKSLRARRGSGFNEAGKRSNFFYKGGFREEANFKQLRIRS